MQTFPTTRWSVLAQATLNGETASRAALEEFCARYRGPIQQVIRLRGSAEHEVEDLGHDFLLHLLTSSSLRRADRSRGRFRSYLLGALVHFLADVHDRRRAQKRGGAEVHVSLDAPAGADDDRPLPLPAPPALELEFDRAWAVAILDRNLARLRAEAEAADGAGTFAVLKQFLPGATEALPYEAAAARLGRPLATVKSDIHRLRRRLRELVRTEVAQTVDAPHEVDAEMTYLQQVLLDRGSELGRGESGGTATPGAT